MSACNRCPAEWSGFNAQHCCVCHSTFSGTTAGDLHEAWGDQYGPTRRRCLTAAEMRAKGMTATPNAFGTPIWSRGAAGYRDGIPRQHPRDLAGRVSDGLSGVAEGDGPDETNEALRFLEEVR